MEVKSAPESIMKCSLKQETFGEGKGKTGSEIFLFVTKFRLALCLFPQT